MLCLFVIFGKTLHEDTVAKYILKKEYYVTILLVSAKKSLKKQIFWVKFERYLFLIVIYSHTINKNFF